MHATNHHLFTMVPGSSSPSLPHTIPKRFFDTSVRIDGDLGPLIIFDESVPDPVYLAFRRGPDWRAVTGEEKNGEKEEFHLNNRDMNSCALTIKIIQHSAKNTNTIIAMNSLRIW